MAVTDNIPWRANTWLYKGQRFQHVGKVYKVINDFKTGATFQISSNFTIDSGGSGGSGADGRGITSAVVNEDGDLIITYTDATQANAGHVRGSNASDNLTSEPLQVTATNVLTHTTSPIDTTKPVTLVVNHLSYSNVETQPAFTISGSTITWDADVEGLNLTTDDIVVVYYFKVSTP